MDGKATRTPFPLSVTGRFPIGNRQELVVSAGVEATTRYLEFSQDEGRRRSRIEWAVDAAGRRSNQGGPFIAHLQLDNDPPHAVEVASGCLLSASAERDGGEPYAPRNLAWLGEALLAITLMRSGPVDGFAAGARAVAQVAKESGGNVVTETAGCLADTAGAGAALGSTGGLVVGGVKGAGVGAAVGGAIGGSFGLGYCVIGPAIKGIWDWITG